MSNVLGWHNPAGPFGFLFFYFVGGAGAGDSAGSFDAIRFLKKVFNFVLEPQGDYVKGAL